MDEASVAQDTQDQYRDQGLQYIFAVTGNNRDTEPTIPQLQSFVEEYGFDDIVVLQVPEAARADLDGEYYKFERDLGIPTVVHISPEMTFNSVDKYQYDPSVYFEDY